MLAVGSYLEAIMKNRSHITSPGRSHRKQAPSSSHCLVESLEGRICMTASITIDPFQCTFGVSEHETIGFANEVGGPTLATLHWQDIPQDPAQFQVSLAWSDGTVTKGGVRTFQNDNNGNPIWEIEQAEPKTFGDPGKLTVNISINQVGHPEVNASTVAFADVEDYPLHATGKAVYANSGRTQFRNVTLATFDDGWPVNGDTDALGTAANFTATINWGDGTMSAGAIVATTLKGRYTVVASHTYTYNSIKGHTYPASVRIVDKNGGQDVIVLTTATIYDAPVIQPINVVTAPLSPFSTTLVDSSKVWN